MKAFPSLWYIRASLYALTGTIALLILSVSGSRLVESKIAPVEEAVMPTALSAVKFDFDGDGKADVSRSRVVTSPTPSSTEIRYRDSGDGTFADYSLSNGSGIIVPGDFNGGGQTDAAVFNGGTWTYKTSTGGTEQTISLGATGDIPVAADYDGDGKTDAAVFRPSTGVWYIKESSTSNTVNTTWGQSGDIPVPGDYDADGKSDFAVWRPSNGIWYLNMTVNGTYTTTWGVSGTDVAVPADYDGDGKTDIAVFRRTTGIWYVRRSDSTPYPDFSTWFTQSWGNYGDQPVPADYDGDGKDDFAVWRPKTGWWWVVYSSNSSIQTFELGVQGEKAVPSAYLQQVGGSVPVNELAAERLKPRNATGSTDLYSQNFSWGRSLVSLPGRAGMDLSLDIGYNSLVWTKADSEIYFDLDNGNPSPGFRLGFPTVEPAYFDEEKGKYAYMMVTTAGSRIQFRETAVSNVFETADSSYTTLVTPTGTDPSDPQDVTMFTVKTTDGTQMKYEWTEGAYRCTEIKDRNGNYISVLYDPYGQLEKMTDTLGRAVFVTYDGDGLPSVIRQYWKADNGVGSEGWHNWATFTYMNMDGSSGRPSFDTSFNSVTPIGPPDGTELKVLQKITYADGSSTKFDYNAYAQVFKVSNIAADSSTHVLNSTETSIGSPNSPSSPADVPRFVWTDNVVENFNNGGAVRVTNDPPTTPASYSLPGSLSINSSWVKVAVVGHPNQLYNRIHFGGSGWREGLVLATEDCTDTGDTCTTRKRWTWTNYTQDNTGVSYILNPRVVETRVGDGTNTKKTAIEYYTTGTPAQYGLAKKIEIGDLSSVKRKVEKEYNLETDYTSRRIIGLPSQVKSWGWNSDTLTLELATHFTYGYDTEAFSYETNQNISSVIRHDNSYSNSFVTGRGNLTTITRHEVPNDTTQIQSKIRYDIAGSAVARIDPLGRKVAIDYTDNFNDTSTTRNTYSYPKQITDPAGYSSTLKYRFDIGANVWAKSPNLNSSTAGKETAREYDDKGRLIKETIANTGAYTEYEYPSNGRQLNTYSTIIDNGTAGPDPGDEVMSETWFDGAGRVIKTVVPHTFSGGSPATWAATRTQYDILGRLIKQSVPTEVDSSGNPTGDDYRGMVGSDYIWLWNQRTFDWKGRVAKVIPSDSSGSDGKEQVIEYEGCGCAGGQVATFKGAVADAIDLGDNLQTTKRRVQKTYEDVLGRTIKREAWDLDAGSLYSSITTDYNGRDQEVKITQADVVNSLSQLTTMGYDGHGRLTSSHKPEQRDPSNNLKYTTYTYNDDDSVHTMTDGRGVITTYSYENASGTPKRALLTGIAWTVPTGSGIADPTDVSYSYDNTGNRTAMTDELGSVSYEYNSLSQMTAETRIFADSLADKPTGNYRLSYEYALDGRLRSYTDPFGEGIEYAHDKAGKITAVTGTSFGGVTSYASNPVYRAWGGLKHLDYGNGFKMDATYNDRLQVATFKVDNPSDSNPAWLDKYYQYYADGKLKFVGKVSPASDNEKRYDRLFSYDFLDRVKYAKSAIEAHGQTETVANKLPYRQTYFYDGFGNTTERNSTLWSTTNIWGFVYTFANNRVIDSGNAYDDDGHQTLGDDINFEYDARGVMSETWRTDSHETIVTRDGDGREGKRRQRIWEQPDEEEGYWEEWEARYFIHSTVLGQDVTEAGTTGAKHLTRVIAGGGAVIARQGIEEGTTAETVGWEHTEPHGLSSRTTYGSATGGLETRANAERDALGNNVGELAPLVLQPFRHPTLGGHIVPFGTSDDGAVEVDGILTPGSMLTGESLALSVPYRMNDGRIVRHSIPFNYANALPGRIAGVTIPDQVMQGPDGRIRTEYPNHGDTLWFGVETGDQIASGVRQNLNDFLSKNPGCAKFLNAMGNTRFQLTEKENAIDDLLEHINIIDATSNNPAILNKSLDELGIVPGNPNPLSEISAGVSARGERNGNVFIFDEFFNEPNLLERGEVVFHEILHVLFGGHQDVVTAVGATHTPPRIPSPPANSVWYAGPDGQARWDADYRARNRREFDDAADVAMRAWIERGCKN